LALVRQYAFPIKEKSAMNASFINKIYVIIPKKKNDVYMYTYRLIIIIE